MGPDRSQALVLDQDSFASSFLILLKPLSSIGIRECFELIHRAFEIAIRGNSGTNSEAEGHIFYHIHHPAPYDLGHFLRHYPQANLLYIMRNPVQSMESWIWDKSANNEKKIADLSVRWRDMVEKIASMFALMHSPFNAQGFSRGVRLEDVKRNTGEVVPRIAEWMGVSDHPALYESSYCGLQYWGPGSKNTGRISGFDTKAIDHPVGRFLGSRDVLIFETLFWPLSSLYGYTELDSSGFQRQLKEIRPWLDEPLEFEEKLYEKLPDQSCALMDLSSYIRLHNLLHRFWELLSRDGTYHNMLKPLDFAK
jgi:hypothetical protein